MAKYYKTKYYKRDKDGAPLKDVIEQYLKSFKYDSRLDHISLINSWESIMGKAVSNKTQEIFINKRTLYIRLTSSVLRQELTYARSKIVALMNENAGKEVIDDVIIK